MPGLFRAFQKPAAAGAWQCALSLMWAAGTFELMRRQFSFMQPMRHFFLYLQLHHPASARGIRCSTPAGLCVLPFLLGCGMALALHASAAVWRKFFASSRFHHCDLAKKKSEKARSAGTAANAHQSAMPAYSRSKPFLVPAQI